MSFSCAYKMLLVLTVECTHSKLLVVQNAAFLVT